MKDVCRLSTVTLIEGCYWPFSADHGYKACWSIPMQSMVRTNANVVVECKRVVKWSAGRRSDDGLKSAAFGQPIRVIVNEHREQSSVDRLLLQRSRFA